MSDGHESAATDCSAATVMPSYWAQINKRRGELIDKQIAESITDDERRELEALQAYTDKILPDMPIKRFHLPDDPPKENYRLVQAQLGVVSSSMRSIDGSKFVKNKDLWSRIKNVELSLISIECEIDELLKADELVG